jgi:hypothetical protein
MSNIGSSQRQIPREIKNNQSPDAIEKSRTIAIARSTRQLIKIMASVLVFAFGWLKLQGLELAPIAKELPASVILKLSLALYFACWVYGTLKDTNFQEYVYEKAPNRGRLPVVGIILCTLLAFIFGLMCLVKTYQQFAIVLTVF